MPDDKDVGFDTASANALVGSQKQPITLTNFALVILLTALVSVTGACNKTARADDPGTKAGFWKFFEVDSVDEEFEQKISEHLASLFPDGKSPTHSSVKLLVEYRFLDAPKFVRKIRGVGVCCGYERTEMYLNLFRTGCTSIVRHRSEKEEIYTIEYIVEKDWSMTPRLTDCLDDLAKRISRAS